MKSLHWISSLRGGGNIVALAMAAPFVLAASTANAAVVISSKATQNMNCSDGVCTPTANDAVLNVDDLEAMLTAGNVSLATTGSGGVQANDIRVVTALSWSSSSALTLDAWRSLAINRPISVEGQAGLALTSDDGSSGGMLSFGKKGHVTFANISSALTVDGVAYTLVSSIKSLADAIAGNPGGAYALASSYDASHDGTYAAAPVSTTFSGSFEGLGNAISILSVDDPVSGDNVGLFAHLGLGGALDDVRLERVSIRGPTQPDDFAGTGGLVGYSEGSLSGNSASGSVSIDASQTQEGGSLGGLVGFTYGGSVTASSSSVSVNDAGIADNSGGLIGVAFGSSVADAHATGKVTGHNALGGLVGFLVGVQDMAQGTVSESYATGDVTGRNVAEGGSGLAAGGLVGAGGFASIVNSYATGNVSHLGQGAVVGGLVGGASNIDVGSSYSTGVPSGRKSAFVGGFLGENTGNTDTMSDAYWDTTTSGTDIGVGEGDDTGVRGRTTQQLQSGLPRGFKRKIWGESPDVNGGLPYLLANPPPGGRK